MSFQLTKEKRIYYPIKILGFNDGIPATLILKPLLPTKAVSCNLLVFTVILMHDLIAVFSGRYFYGYAAAKTAWKAYRKEKQDFT